MELRTLRSFLAVAQEGNVTRAARRLHITQPALSRQLSELEREMGCTLLSREARGVTLTDEGMLLRKRAEEIVDLADRTERELRSPAADITGDVWVGGGESRAMALVAAAATRILTDYPKIRLRIHSGNGTDVIERLDKGLLDFGVIFSDAPKNRYESIVLPHEDRWGILMRRNHPLATRESLTLADLRGERLIVSGEQVGFHEILRMVEENGCRVAATYTLLYNAALLVEAGTGLAICFDGIIRAGDGTPYAYVPLDEAPVTRAHLIWKRAQPMSRACGTFLHALREQCGQSPS